MKLIIDIPKDVYKKTVFYREFKDLNDCVTTIKALENGTPIPDNATNGNIVIKTFCKGIVRINSRKNVSVEFNKDWWNSLYQKGGRE